ncbi:MAG TPA: tetratricopeptide repeat protein [Myxococcota bacterium]|jgi:tetratricopeptide (TPR) repeat protein|nr:tetratricopeptide repeat protein [Myxococcota bacterium]
MKSPSRAPFPWCRPGFAGATTALALAAAAAVAVLGGGCRGDHTAAVLAAIRDGDGALEHGDFRGASDSYERAVKLRDDLAPGWIGLGRALAGLSVRAAEDGDLRGARERATRAADAFRKAIVLDAGAVEAYVGLGAAYEFLGDSERAYPVLLRVVDMVPGDARAHGMLAVVMTDVGRHAEAMPHYEKALDEFPDDPNLLLKLGKSLVAIDHAEEALGVYLRYHEVAPGDPRYLQGVGDAFLAAGHGAEALEAYKRLESAGPAFRLDALQGEGSALLLMGDASAAADRFREGIDLLDRLGVGAPRLGKAPDDAGDATGDKGDKSDKGGKRHTRGKGGDEDKSAKGGSAGPDADLGPHARKELREALAGLNFGLGRALVAQKHDADAVGALRAALAADEGHLPAMTLLGSVLMGLKRYDEATSTLEQLVKKAPWSEIGAGMLADVLSMTKHYDRAAREYERAVAIAPNNATLLNNYAWMLVTAEDKRAVDCARAVTLAEKAVELSDYRNAPSLDTLAEAYHCVGRTADALRIIGMAIHVTPDDEALYDRRAKYESALAPKKP